jgi:hypothetical protein
MLIFLTTDFGCATKPTQNQQTFYVQEQLGLYIPIWQEKESYTISVDHCQILPERCVATHPQLNHTMALWWQFDTISTNFPWSNFKGKTIIPPSVEIHNTLATIFSNPLCCADIDSRFLEFLHCAALR